MTTTATIDLVFRVTRDDGLPCTCDDHIMLDDHLGEDGDCLSLEGGRFILNDVRWSTPDWLNGALYVSFEVEVESYEGDNLCPEALLSEAYEAAILHMPDYLQVNRLTATIA